MQEQWVPRCPICNCGHLVLGSVRFNPNDRTEPPNGWTVFCIECTKIFTVTEIVYVRI
jgi:hypothetical protein